MGEALGDLLTQTDRGDDLDVAPKSQDVHFEVAAVPIRHAQIDTAIGMVLKGLVTVPFLERHPFGGRCRKAQHSAFCRLTESDAISGLDQAGEFLD